MQNCPCGCGQKETGQKDRSKGATCGHLVVWRMCTSLIWNPKTGKIVPAASVRFVENVVGRQAQEEPEERISIEGGWPEVSKASQKKVQKDVPIRAEDPEEKEDQQTGWTRKRRADRTNKRTDHGRRRRKADQTRTERAGRITGRTSYMA